MDRRAFFRTAAVVPLAAVLPKGRTEGARTGSEVVSFVFYVWTHLDRSNPDE